MIDKKRMWLFKHRRKFVGVISTLLYYYDVVLLFFFIFDERQRLLVCGDSRSTKRIQKRIFITLYGIYLGK